MRSWRDIEDEDVCAGTTVQRVVAGSADQRIVAAAATGQVVAGRARKEIVSRARGKEVLVLVADQPIIARAAQDRVVTAKAECHEWRIAGSDAVVSASRFDPSDVQKRDAARAIGRATGQRPGPKIGNDRAAHLHHDPVRAASAIDGVVAVGSTEEECFVGGVADQRIVATSAVEKGDA